MLLIKIIFEKIYQPIMVVIVISRKSLLPDPIPPELYAFSNLSTLDPNNFMSIYQTLDKDNVEDDKTIRI